MMVRSILEILALFILPIVVIVTGIIPRRRRLYLLWIVSLMVLVIIAIERIPAAALGIRTDNLNESLVPYAFFTLAGLGVIMLLAKVLNRHPVADWRSDRHFLWLFIPISIAQEFLYRGFLFVKLEEISSNAVFIIIANTLVFTLLHGIYRNKRVNVPFAALSGVAFAAMYYLFPNLILISISHMVLNFLAVLYGFFSDTAPHNPSKFQHA